MPGYGMSLYVLDEDVEVYQQNKAFLHDKAREAFEKELFKIKECIRKASELPGVNPIIEDLSDDRVHEEFARKSIKRAEDKLYKESIRHNKGR
jgi:hypothetical protein